MFLRPWRPLVPSFSTVLRLEVEEKVRRGKNDCFDPIGGARLRLYLTRNRHTCQTTRESRVAVAHIVTLYVVVRSWLIDKQAKKMQPAQNVVGEAVITWPGPAGRCRRTIADVDEPSKKRQPFIFGVPCVRLLIHAVKLAWLSALRDRDRTISLVRH